MGLGVVLAVYTIIFFLLRLVGDPMLLLVPEDFPVLAREALRKELGLDKPAYVQYFLSLVAMLKGNFGHSFHWKQPAMTLVLQRIPATLELVFWAMLISILVAVPAGVVSAVKRGKWQDKSMLVGSLLAISAPSFWVAIFLIYVFVVELQWLPASGRGNWLNLVLPAGSLALYRVALTIRLVRSGMLETLGQDYIRTARAKGLSERTVVYKHALRNTMVPVVTIIGLQTGALLTGSIVTERIFAWPGMGWLIVEALSRLDYPVVTAYAIFTSVIFVVMNLVVDLAYGLLDPKVRYS